MTYDLFYENYLNYNRDVRVAVGQEIDIDTNTKPVPPVPPGGPKNNEIWYTGEYYDMQAAIDYISNSDYGWGEPYIGPNLLSNEFDGEKWILTFDGPITHIGDIVDEEENWYSYPMFITEYDEKEQEHSIECNVTSVILPDSVTEIQDGFQSCDNLTAVDLGNGIVSIGDFAFYGCTGLTSITIPNSVTSIGLNAFENAGLENVNYLGTIASWNSIEKDVNWEEGLSVDVIHCIDGDAPVRAYLTFDSGTGLPLSTIWVVLKDGTEMSVETSQLVLKGIPGQTIGDIVTQEYLSMPYAKRINPKDFSKEVNYDWSTIIDSQFVPVTMDTVIDKDTVLLAESWQLEN